MLSGECLLLVEGQERTLRAWDFFHCPGGTDHMIVGAGDGPSVVLAVGGRGGRKGIVYPVDALALAHDAGVEEETDEARRGLPGLSRLQSLPVRERLAARLLRPALESEPWPARLRRSRTASSRLP